VLPARARPGVGRGLADTTRDLREAPVRGITLDTVAAELLLELLPGLDPLLAARSLDAKACFSILRRARPPFEDAFEPP
jgi:hypothetical protein